MESARVRNLFKNCASNGFLAIVHHAIDKFSIVWGANWDEWTSSFSISNSLDATIDSTYDATGSRVTGTPSSPIVLTEGAKGLPRKKREREREGGGMSRIRD